MNAIAETDLTMDTPNIHQPTAPRPTSRWKTPLITLLVLGSLVGVGSQFNRIKGLLASTRHEKPEAAVPSASKQRPVYTVKPSVDQNEIEVLLPAQLLPYEQTTLYSRIDGYVKKWHIDRGTSVKRGQVLAEIDAPEMDQQVNQAQAALEQGKAMLVQIDADLDQAKAELDRAKSQIRVAEANKEYAERELVRTTGLLRTQAIGRTDHEANVRNRDVMEATLVSARADLVAKEKAIASRAASIGTQEATNRGLEANLQRLKEMQNFKFITAPFDGYVTRRYVETGMMVQTLNSPQLYHMQDSSRLRIQIDVPQVYAQQARKSKVGEVIVPEIPDRTFTAEVKRTGSAININTRTLAVELEMENAERTVLAGTYAQVRLKLPAARPTVTVPVNALRYTSQGIEVVVHQDGVLKVQPVKLGRNLGKSMEIVSGLDGTEELVANPADDLQTGEAALVRK
jgi:RND family efflux transporter MFP subunit